MNISKLKDALTEIKADMEAAIVTASFNGRSYDNGQKAKEALIRSSRLILKIHEVTKESLHDKLTRLGLPYAIYPPLGASSPELPVTGFIKKKRQDIVVLVSNVCPECETVADGPLQGIKDPLGASVTKTSVVISIRSQLSSVGKNFDTLMERAFAETLNLRLRFPGLVMGEVYLLPLFEYMDEAMKENRVEFNRQPIPIDKFIRTFVGISGRSAETSGDIYKYERTALILADFRKNPPELCLTPSDLVRFGVNSGMANKYQQISPLGFASDILDIHLRRHKLR
jgi:hypothetical protein